MIVNADCSEDITEICKLIIQIDKFINSVLNKNLGAGVNNSGIAISYDGLKPVDSFGIAIKLTALNRKSFLLIKKAFSKYVGKLAYPFKMPSIVSRQDTIGFYEIETQETNGISELTENELVLLFGFCEW